MNKGLEAFERTRLRVGEDYTIEQYASDYKTVQKELKALEIIKKKLPPLMLRYLLDFCNKEEFDLLKEVLEK